MYRSHQIAARLGVSPQTVRTWAIEFASVLSEGARPAETGAHRAFSEQDVRVFTFVRAQRQQNNLRERKLSADDLLASIRQAIDTDSLPEIPPAPPNRHDHAGEVQTALISWHAERQVLQQQIADREAQLSEARLELAGERAARAADAERLLRELASVKGELRELDVLVRLYEQGRLRPPG